MCGGNIDYFFSDDLDRWFGAMTYTSLNYVPVSLGMFSFINTEVNVKKMYL